MSFFRLVVGIALCAVAAAMLFVKTQAPRAAADGTLEVTHNETVAILQSEASLRVSSWLGRWETDGAVALLRQMGLAVRILTDQDLETGQLENIHVLVVPNARCISQQAAQQVSRFVANGGRLLATGMAAYRDEANRKVGLSNNFQWADLYGADFQRFLNSWPRCEFLALDPSLGKEVATLLHRDTPLARVQLGRNTAMLVTARPSTTVLATWLDADGTTPTTDAGSGSAAIVCASDNRVIYVGENLLAPELSRSPEVSALLLALLQRLDAAAMPKRLAKSLQRTPAAFTFPVGPASTVAPGGPTIRVGIHQGLQSLGVSSSGGLIIGDRPPTKPGQVVRLQAGVTPYLSLEGRGNVSWPLLIKSVDSSPLQALDIRPNGTCKAHAFRGALEVRLVGNKMAVINVLSIEEYTAGVVPNEVPGTYPLDALKAMAVIARTFSLARRDFHAKDGFDVCDTVHCQMYGGFLTEWESSNRAVQETAGEVIEYHGTLTDSTFHAVCGGIGEDVDKVWPQAAAPYLVGQVDGPAPLGDLSDEDAFRKFIDVPPDAYCSASPRFRWMETYRGSELQTLFEKSLPVTLGQEYHGLGAVQDVRVLSRSRNGRVQVLEIVGTQGTYRVEKDRIRWLWCGGVLGQGGLQSTLFYVHHSGPANDSVFVFRGGGWGHGVGMCQDGASGMALRGIPYDRIIEHYYPHTELAHLQASSARHPLRGHAVAITH